MTPLPRFVPRDKLILYVDFDGLDAHAEAWQKTAAYKMLNQTPLGVMLEEVAAQLLDKALEGVPNRKLSGAEIVTLVKLMARKGWVLALNANLTGPNPFVGTLVLRGAAAKDKEIKSITSRLIGTLMGPEPKPRIERKAGRPGRRSARSCCRRRLGLVARKGRPGDRAHAAVQLRRHHRRSRRQGALRGRSCHPQRTGQAGRQFRAAHDGDPRSDRRDQDEDGGVLRTAQDHDRIEPPGLPLGFRRRRAR